MPEICLANLNQASHATAVLDLLEQYARHPLGGGDGLSDYTRQNLVDSLLDRNDCSVILAFDDNRAVGLCIGFEGFSTFACRPLVNIHDVFVHQDYRGQGIARSMMSRVEQLAREKGCCKITLEVLSHNDSAKSAYRSIGYVAYRLDERYGQAEFWQKLITRE